MRWRARSAAAFTGLLGASAALAFGSSCAPAAPPVVQEPPPPRQAVTGTAPAAPTSTAAATSTPAPMPQCPATCDGHASRELQAALSATARTAIACYQRFLREADASGSAMVSLSITESGALCRVDVILPASLTSMEGCIRERFTTTPLPPPGDGCARVNVPLNFVIHERDAGPDASPAH